MQELKRPGCRHLDALVLVSLAVEDIICDPEKGQSEVEDALLRSIV